jgi:hypothetical protein
MNREMRDADARHREPGDQIRSARGSLASLAPLAGLTVADLSRDAIDRAIRELRAFEGKRMPVRRMEYFALLPRQGKAKDETRI